MVNSIKKFFAKLAKSRLLTISFVLVMLAVIMLQKIFSLQIIQGKSYLNDYTLKIEKSKDIVATRGSILDRNGKVLAYNELAYSVVIEDNGNYSNSDERNKEINKTIAKTIKIMEDCGDKPDNDFNIVYNNNDFEYTVDGTQRLRFIADIFGYLTVDELGVNKKLGFNEATATARQLMEYIMYNKYEIDKKYNEKLAYEIAIVRYGMSSNYYQKYISTTIATDVSDETVAAINENNTGLQGVSIEENTLRKYVDSQCFCHITGYTGKISDSEYQELHKKDKSYTLNDYVGKSGIEEVMESYLKGKKGSETFYVDSVGKVLETISHKDSKAGNNVYLSIDKDLQEAVYKILEQKIAGVLYGSIRNIKEYRAGSNSTSSDVVVPIYDVYYALLDNNVIDIDEFTSEDAMSNEKAVYQAFKSNYKTTTKSIQSELKGSGTKYKDLDNRMTDYVDYIYDMLKNNNIIMTDAIDKEDATYQKWTSGKISFKKYLNYCISKAWIDRTTLSDEKGKINNYSDSDEIYAALVDKIIAMLPAEKEFHKLVYKYMILDDKISGHQICMILYEQDILAKNDKDYSSLKNNSMTAFEFLRKKIKNLEITPAQLALDPCSGSTVVMNPKTGEILACVSYPGYDNNKLANVVDSGYYNELLADNATPLYDFATQQETAPGSTFKPLSSIAGLMEGVISTGETITDKGVFEKVSNKPRCWIYSSSHATHGSINVSGALRDSCNYFFYEVGYRLATMSGSYNDEKGITELEKYADLFGLTEKTGVEISESKPSFATEFPVMAAIGQSNNNFTTIGLGRYVSAIANSGRVYDLTLLDKVETTGGKTIKKYSPDVKNDITEVPSAYWSAVHSGMRMVVENLGAFNDVKTPVAGKTGTAQQIKTRPSHALFIGYAPYKKPKISIATRIPFGYSSSNAAEVAADVIKYYFEEEDVLKGKASSSSSRRTLD
ncbi:MAG: peptidoglycan glycosyltransferase [Lachnospiraceae bacterium]|nr:peptidoglycan glycosyltransferase [Lachnospiraceae bacterium]